MIIPISRWFYIIKPRYYNSDNMAARTEVKLKDKALLKAMEVDGQRAFKAFMKFLTKKNIKNIEQSVKEFHANFKLG